MADVPAGKVEGGGGGGGCGILDPALQHHQKEIIST